MKKKDSAKLTRRERKEIEAIVRTKHIATLEYVKWQYVYFSISLIPYALMALLLFEVLDWYFSLIKEDQIYFGGILLVYCILAFFGIVGFLLRWSYVILPVIFFPFVFWSNARSVQRHADIGGNYRKRAYRVKENPPKDEKERHLLRQYFNEILQDGERLLNDLTEQRNKKRRLIRTKAIAEAILYVEDAVKYAGRELGELEPGKERRTETRNVEWTFDTLDGVARLILEGENVKAIELVLSDGVYTVKLVEGATQRGNSREIVIDGKPCRLTIPPQNVNHKNARLVVRDARGREEEIPLW